MKNNILQKQLRGRAKTLPPEKLAGTFTFAGGHCLS
jgi:hypothetical protein